MFTASQLLDKINNHLSENQITRTPEGLYEPIEYILSLGGKADSSCIDADGI